MSVHPDKQLKIGRFSKERIGVLGIWFLLLIGIRTLFGLALENIWIGTVGAIGVTFAIFYFSLRYTKLRKHAPLINHIITGWYKKRYFIISIIAMMGFGSVLFFIDYGYTHHADKLITIDVDENDPMGALVASEYSELALRQNLEKYSYLDILAITFASADKTLGGYYSKIVNYMLAEDIEVMLFLVFIQRKKEIFTAPAVLAR